MKNFWRKFILYLALPEMRPFWFLVLTIVVLMIINFLYLPRFWIFVSGLMFLIMITSSFVTILRLAGSNLEIKVERNELKSIISNLRDGIIAYDPNFNILIFNQAAEAIFGIKSKDVIGKNITPDLAKESGLKLLVQVMFPSLAPIVVRRSETENFPQIVDMSFEEPKLELRVITERISDPSGHVLGFVKLAHDRTRELELLRSKDEFITVAAHQLRTPLSAINWALENLAKEQLNDSAKEIVDSGLGAAAKLLKTVNDLLDVSKIEEGRFGYDFQKIEIVSFAEGIIREFKELSKNSTVSIYLKRPEEASIEISADPQKLKIVFFNLLDNALKYNIQNGEIVVAVEKLKGQPFVEISVKDTGIGIPQDEIKKLFTKFFRAENVVRYVTEGSGLGLYITKNIIKRHGGQIRAESELNRGSVFYFTLPVDPKLIPPKEMIYGEE